MTERESPAFAGPGDKQDVSQNVNYFVTDPTQEVKHSSPTKAGEIREKILAVVEESRAKFAHTTTTESQAWTTAQGLFPSRPFPWEIFPPELADGLRQLARACATGDSALPGVAFCILGAALGRALSVSPKAGWREPLIFYVGDIRPSGAGKTPAATELVRVLHGRQAKEHLRWKAEADHWRGLPKKERESTPEPRRARSFFVSDLTLEGLRVELDDHPTGGLVVVHEELSSFISCQNAYRGGRGSDREAWISLWSGHPARVVRKAESVFLNGGRVSVFGGIQPGVFRAVFSDQGGLFLADGTLFRFLLTTSDCVFHELTTEAWADEHRRAWEALVDRAFFWAGERVDSPLTQVLSTEAQDRFLGWRNDLEARTLDLPEVFRGFLPKAYSYALRLTGALHALDRFSRQGEPGAVLTLDDLNRGIRAVEFYLGQTVQALQVLEDPFHSVQATDERVIQLAVVLDALRGHTDSGRLAVGFIHDALNQCLPEHQRFQTPRATGAFLRSLGLTIPRRKHDANGRRAVSCLLWDGKIETFLERRLQSLHSL